MSVLLLSPGSPPLLSPHCSAPWPQENKGMNEYLIGHLEKNSHCWPRKKNTFLPQKKELAMRRGEQLATHKLNLWLWTFLYAVFSFYQTPRWHVFSKWTILAEVYVDLFTENLLFPVSYSLTFSQEKGLLECFCGKIKIKSSPVKSSPHLLPAARVSAEC